MLTGGVGTGHIQVRITDADSETQLFGSPVHEITYPPDRHEISGVALRVERCVFPRPGLYWVEFHHDGYMLWREPLTVR